MNWQNQTIAIVGGTSGMGLAAAKAIANKDATVVIVSRSLEKLDIAKSAISGKVESYQLDFTDEIAVKEFFSSSGKIDHLVLVGAGQAAWGSFVDLDSTALHNAFTNKFWGYFYCSKYAIPNLRQDGSIIFVVGAACRTAIPNTAGLAAVNGAIVSMALTLAKELAPLRVNVISPGLVDTPAYDGMPESEKQAFFQHMGSNLPVGRVGQPSEIAEAILFLLGNGFVTGSVLDVDGGARFGS
jgi:NAD(P)-dependent dehydrogenase (short-subunit alcohol dehydrogenase family)